MGTARKEEIKIHGPRKPGMGGLGSLMEKLRHPISSVCLLWTIEQRQGLLQKNKEAVTIFPEQGGRLH